MKWIDFSFSPSSETETEQQEPKQESNSAEIQQPFKSKLNQSMIDLIPTSRTLPAHSKRQLLDYLAKYDVFCSDELNDFSKTIRRMSSSGTIFDADLFKKRDDNSHLKFILSLINRQNIPVNFVWYYLNFYK